MPEIIHPLQKEIQEQTGELSGKHLRDAGLGQSLQGQERFQRKEAA